MASTSHRNSEEKPATQDPDPLSLHKAEYEATIAEHKQLVKSIGPARKEYEALSAQHKKIQAQQEILMTKRRLVRSKYQRHKQYVISLSNALLASQNALRSATNPSDLQALTQATLLIKFRSASDTLLDLILQNKRLDYWKEKGFKLDQDFYQRCEDLFKVVERDCGELDRLHAKVLDLEKKLGLTKSDCAAKDRKCASCDRNEEREARRAAAEKKSKRGRRISGGTRKAAEGKQRLEDILEEGELREGADASD